MSTQAKSLRALIPGLVGFIVITAALIIGINAIGLDRIRDGIASAGAFAPLIYIAIKVVTYVVAPLSSGPLQLFSGVLFGLIPGTLYTLIGEVIGGSINFWLARRFGRPVVERLVGEDNLPRVDSFVSQIVDWKTLLYARLFLFSFYDFISYAVGFSTLNFRIYLIISALAGFVPTFIASLIGTSMTSERGSLLLIYGLVAIASVIPLLFQKRIRHFLRLDSTTPRQKLTNTE
ncbi:MAG: VTT domain-containing protein [Chloroflexota bacterium]